MLYIINKLYICAIKQNIMYRIKEILTQKGMTAKSLAEKMGVTPQYISGIIRETGSASVEVLSNIANVLEVPVSSLFEDYVSNNNNTITCPVCQTRFKIDSKKDITE